MTHFYNIQSFLYDEPFWWTGRGSNPGRDRTFFSFPIRLDELCDPLSILLSGHRNRFPGVKRTERDIDHWSLSSAELKNGWNYASIPNTCLYGWIVTDLPCTILILSSPMCLGLPSVSQPKTGMHFFSSPFLSLRICVTGPPLLLLNFMTWTIFCEEYWEWSSSLCNFF